MSSGSDADEDYGFDSESEYQDSGMDVDEDNEFGFDPADDVDASSRRVRRCLLHFRAITLAASPAGVWYWRERGCSGSSSDVPCERLLQGGPCYRVVLKLQQVVLSAGSNRIVAPRGAWRRCSIRYMSTASVQTVYEVLNERQLRERQAEALEAVTSVTGIPEGEAVRVLRHFKW